LRDGRAGVSSASYWLVQISNPGTEKPDRKRYTREHSNGLFGLGTFLSRFAGTGTLTLVYVGMYSTGRGGVRSRYGSNIACLLRYQVLYGPNARDRMSVDTSIVLGSMAASGMDTLCSIECTQVP
jgi:hypothetical protein